MELLPEGGAVPQVRLGSFLEETSDPSSSRDGERRGSHGLRGGGGPDSQRDPPTPGRGGSAMERDPRGCSERQARSKTDGGWKGISPTPWVHQQLSCHTELTSEH